MGTLQKMFKGLQHKTPRASLQTWTRKTFRNKQSLQCILANTHEKYEDRIYYVFRNTVNFKQIALLRD